MKTVSQYIEEKFGIDTRLFNPENAEPELRKYINLLDNTNGYAYIGKEKFILINENLPYQEQKAYFFHELGHALLDTWQDEKLLEKRITAKASEMSQSEFFAEIFAAVMYALEIHRGIIFDEVPERSTKCTDINVNTVEHILIPENNVIAFQN